MKLFKEKTKYYRLDKIKQYKAQYNIIIGERSNGKTYAVLEEIVKNFFEKHKQGAVVRRWREDFKGKRGGQFFSALVSNGLIEKYSGGAWTGVYYYSGRWYFSRTYEDEKGNEKVEKMEEPFCYGFSITEMEHDKSTSYPDITTILFDEFLARSYIPDEFILFMNVLSTIIRQRRDVTIYMCGNTVSHYCPYFKEMGLKHIKQMEQGHIDVYTYGESDLRVAVEYCKPLGESKKSDMYFAFDNSRLQMITKGAFELEVYPHLPVKYAPCDVKYRYYIEYEDELLTCEVVVKKDVTFTYIHKKTTPLKEEKTDLIFGPDRCDSIYHRQNITIGFGRMGTKLWDFYKRGEIYYQDNEVGETMNSYLEYCKNLR